VVWLSICSDQLIAVTCLQVSRYRHYGVYLTGERDQEGQEEILNDPVCVLDRKTFQQFLELNSIPPSILDRKAFQLYI
jgi:hypothetical protein